MKTLTDQACSTWLNAQGIVEAPYGKEHCPTAYAEQFRLHDTPALAGHLARVLIGGMTTFGTALLQFTDWSLYSPDEMAVITTLRAAHGDHGLLVDTPGHLFAAAESDLLAGIFALAISYRWTAYLYFDDHTTMMCWEGDLLDFWTSNAGYHQTVRQLFQRPTNPS